MEKDVMKIEEELMGFGLSEVVAKQLAHDYYVLQRTMYVGNIAQMRHAGLSDDKIAIFLNTEEATIRTLMGENLNGEDA